MARYFAASACALGIALGSVAPAAAYSVDPNTKALTIDSLRDFDQCQKEHDGAGSEACLDALRLYVKSHPNDTFEAGKRVRLYYMHWVALDFFAQALGDKPARKQCADEDVSAAVVSGLALPPHYPAVLLAKKLLGETCRAELAPVVIAQLKGASGYFRSNACPLLADKVSSAQCSVVDEPKPQAKPAPAAQLSPADQQAAAARLRKAHPERKETPHPVPVQQLTQTFPAVAGEPSKEPTNAVAELKGLDWRLLNLDADHVEVLRGAHGEELTIERTKPGGQAYVVLKFKGVRSPWNERVLVAVERAGATGKDYVAVVDGRESVVMIERQRQYQAFPKGVTGGIWLNPHKPGEPAIALPNRRSAAGGVAAATDPSK